MNEEKAKLVLSYFYPSYDINAEELGKVDKYVKNLWISAMESVRDIENCSEGSLSEQYSIRQLQRLYGSPGELAENVAAYQNFCGSQGKDKELFMHVHEPVLYKTLGNKSVYFKQDMLVRLFYICMNSFEFEFGMLESMAMVVLMKYLEEKLPNRCEFISNDEFYPIYAAILKLRLELKEKIKTPHFENFREAFTFFKKMLPDGWSGQENCRQQAELEKLFSDADLEVLTDIIHVLNYSMKATKETIEKHPSFFSSTSETESAKPFKAIRLFLDGKKKFLMRREVAQLLGKGCKDSDVMKAVEYNQVFSYLKTIEGLEFVLTPIQRTKHRAQPIRDSNWKLCKLASDVFLEAFKDAFYGFRLFQRVNEQDWKDIEICFEKLDTFFHLEEKAIYFIPLEEVNNIPSAERLFSFAKDRPVREIRDVGPNGFTAEDLRDELERLEFPRMFPDILEFVDIAYKFVLREKNSNKLRTCDLITAVVQCQMICLLRRYPKIAYFLHNQNGCHQIAYIQCCSKLYTQYQLTQWSEIQFSQAKVVCDKKTFAANCLVCPGGKVLSYNLAWNSLDKNDTDRSTLIFMADAERIAELHAADQGNEQLKRFSSFANCQKMLTNVYLRFISLTTTNQDANRAVFSEEVLDMIPYLVKRQKGHLDLDLFKQYTSRWVSTNRFRPKVMTLDQLAVVLEDFDVDKRQITLVPDIKSVAEFCGPQCKIPLNGVSWLSPSSQFVTHTSEAIFMLFSRGACFVHWNMDEKLRDLILQEMTRIAIKPDTFDRIDMTFFKKLQYAPIFVEAREHDFSKTFYAKDAHQMLNMDAFLEICEKFELKIKCPEEISKEKLSEASLPMWKARLLLFTEWSTLFFGDDHPVLKEHVRNRIFGRIPKDSSNVDFKNAILEKLQMELFDLENPPTPADIAHEKESLAILTEIWEFSELSQRYGLSGNSMELMTGTEMDVNMATKKVGQIELPTEVRVSKNIKKNTGIEKTLRASSSPSSPPSTHPSTARDKAKKFGRLLQMQKDSQESEEEPKINQKPPILRYEYFSKKKKSRFNRRAQKKVMCPRKAVTDKSPASNACLNKKCRRMNEFNKKKDATIEMLKGQVKKLERENERLEKEKKEILEASAKKEERVAQELFAAQIQIFTANSHIITLEEELADVKLQLRMASETRVKYLEFMTMEQKIRLEKPLDEISRQAEKIIEHATEQGKKDGAEYELEKFRREFDDFTVELTEKIRALRENPEKTDVQPMKTKFPKVSKLFERAYEDVLRAEVQRLKNG